MGPRRGIRVTVFLFVLVLAVFAILTVLLPDLNENELPIDTNGTGSVTMTESEFAEWLNGSYGNISTVVAQIQSTGMGMGNTTGLDQQLQIMADHYIAELNNITVTPSAGLARTEFMAALEDYREAATQRIQSSGMSKIDHSLEYFLKASIHANNALQEMSRLSS